MSNLNYNGNFRSPPTWAGDFGGREHVMPFPARLNVAAFPNGAGIKVTLTANASADDTSITVTALTAGQGSVPTTISGGVLIPAGAMLDFGGKKFARVTADADAGDTSIAVAALPTALVIGDTTAYSKYGRRFIPSGTFIGRTLAERDASTAFGPAAATDDELYLTYNDVNVTDGASEVDVELYRHDSLVKENYLPDYTTLSTAANEVQTVTVDTILSGGKIGITAIDKNGVPQAVAVAYNSSWTTTVGDIQTALNALLGTSAVAAAVTNTKDMTLTFSGTDYAGIAQPRVTVDISGATGPTKATVTRTTPGGTPLLGLIRAKYQCVVGKN